MAAFSWIWLVVGVVVGLAVFSQPGGAIFGGIAGFLISRVHNLTQQLEDVHKRLEVTTSGLKARVADLEARLRSAATPEDAEATQAAAEQSPVREQAQTQVEPEPVVAPVPPTPAEATTVPGVQAQPEAVPEPEPESNNPWDTPPPRKTGGGSDIGQRIFSWLTGGNPVVRLGIVILFFGVSFLIKYASERNILPIELRLAGVALAAVAVLVTGWRLRERAGAYGLVLQGGAVAVLYLTIFGSMKLYHLLPGAFAFVLMVALVALSGVLAVLQNAKVLALFGAAGGFVTPILLSSGGGNHVALFSYYAVLNAGIFGIAWFKSWRELNVLGFVFTFVIGAAWGYTGYRPEYFNSTEPFLVLFFLFYVAIAVLFAHRQPPHLKGYIDGSLVFGVPLVGFTLQSALVRNMEYGMAFSALSLSAVYILLARALWKRQVDGMRMLTEAFLALGVVFGSLAIPLALDGRWTAATWGLEGAALVWVGVHQQRRLARWFGLLLQFGAGIAFLVALDSLKAPHAIWNGAYLGGLVVSLAGLFSSWQLQRHKDKLMSYEQHLALPVFAWGLLWWCGIGLREIDLHLTSLHQPFGVLGFAAFSGWLASATGRRLDWSTMGRVTLALLPVLILIALALFDNSRFRHPAQDWGWWAWPAALAVQLWILRGGTRDWPDVLPSFWHAGGFLLFIFLGTWQIAWGVDQLADGSRAWPLLMWGAVPALSLLLMMKLGSRMRWPVNAFPEAYLGSGLVPLAGFLWLWGMFGCIQEGNPAPLPYVPIINPLDLVQLLCLYTLVRWWRQPGAVNPAAAEVLRQLLPAAIALGAFAWLNALVARTVHFWAGVPFTWHDLHHSMIYQASVSVLWSTSALAVMVYASRFARRVVWFAGSVILALVVIKLFFVDLSSSGTVARIVSFLVVGGLMLVIGYFSPLPPNRPVAKDT